MIHSTTTTINRIEDNNNFNQIILGDALTELKKLPDAFVDVCVTSTSSARIQTLESS